MGLAFTYVLSGDASIFTQLVNYCWSLFKWALLFAMAAVILGGGYLYLRLDDEIRRQVERRIGEHYSGMVVHVGRARFEQDRGVAIFDIAIADGRPGASPHPMLSIGEMYLSGNIRMDELVTDALTINEIVIRRAALRAVRHADGTWNFHSLLPFPQFGNDSPTVRIEDATVVVEDTARPQATQTFQGIDLVLVLDATQSAATGRKYFRIEGCAAGVPACELRVQGTLGMDDGVANLRITLAGMDVSSQMLSALPGVPANSLAGIEISGRVNATVDVNRNGLNEPVQWAATVALDRGRLQHAKLPEPVTEMRFTAQATPERLTIKRLDAK